MDETLKDAISIGDFGRLDLRVAEVKSCEPHPNADKLLVLRVDVGPLGERQLVAGLRAYYQSEYLVGRKIVIVANLEPATLRGVESQGMLLAAGTGEAVAFLTPEKDMPAGSQVR